MSDIFINSNVLDRDTINEVIDDKDVAKHTTIQVSQSGSLRYL